MVGWSSSTRRDTLASLLLATNDDGQFFYRGRVGTGFNTVEAERIQGLLETRERKSSPVERAQPAFDSDVSGSLAEQGVRAALEAGVHLTSPDRVVFPDQGVTKAKLARYYAAVAERMLPFIANRPLSLLRCPQGRAKKCFFQKHDTGGFPDQMRTIRLTEKDGSQHG